MQSKRPHRPSDRNVPLNYCLSTVLSTQSSRRDRKGCWRHHFPGENGCSVARWRCASVDASQRTRHRRPQARERLPRKRGPGIQTIYGQVTACNSETGEPEMILDGPTLTGRRTAAVSILGIRKLKHKVPRRVLIIIGTGTQATHHVAALHDIFPETEVLIRGSSAEQAIKFCRKLALAGMHSAPVRAETPEHVDTVITLTTSRTPVYRGSPRNERLVIGVGSFQPEAAEIASDVVLASEIFVDDFHGARDEAGDLLLAGIDWSAVRTLSSLAGRPIDGNRPIFLKSVGSGVWDLAACRVARATVLSS